MVGGGIESDRLKGIGSSSETDGGFEARVEVVATQCGAHALSAAESTWKCKHAELHYKNLKNNVSIKTKSGQ